MFKILLIILMTFLHIILLDKLTHFKILNMDSIKSIWYVDDSL